jgi:hypothetical protein
VGLLDGLRRLDDRALGVARRSPYVVWAEANVRPLLAADLLVGPVLLGLGRIDPSTSAVVQAVAVVAFIALPAVHVLPALAVYGHHRGSTEAPLWGLGVLFVGPLVNLAWFWIHGVRGPRRPEPPVEPSVEPSAAPDGTAAS